MEENLPWICPSAVTQVLAQISSHLTQKRLAWSLDASGLGEVDAQFFSSWLLENPHLAPLLLSGRLSPEPPVLRASRAKARTPGCFCSSLQEPWVAAMPQVPLHNPNRSLSSQGGLGDGKPRQEQPQRWGAPGSFCHSRHKPFRNPLSQEKKNIFLTAPLATTLSR